MADQKNSYEGKVKNTGAQEIPALHPQAGSKDTTIQRGRDLRTGKSGK